LNDESEEFEESMKTEMSSDELMATMMEGLKTGESDMVLRSVRNQLATSRTNLGIIRNQLEMNIETEQASQRLETTTDRLKILSQVLADLELEMRNESEQGDDDLEMLNC